MPPKEAAAYVARSKRAARFTAETAGDAVKQLLPLLERSTEEAAQLKRALQEAELAETDESHRGRYEQAFQKLGAIHRITGEVEAGSRQLVKAWRELEEANARIAEHVGAPEPVTVRGEPAPKPRAPKRQAVVHSKPER